MCGEQWKQEAQRERERERGEWEESDGGYLDEISCWQEDQCVQALCIHLDTHLLIHTLHLNKGGWITEGAAILALCLQLSVQQKAVLQFGMMHICMQDRVKEK